MMLHFLYEKSLQTHPKLAASMYKDRTIQFRDRLGWSVRVNELGQERDQYDDMNPLYVILASEEAEHLASMRLLPTVGKTMVNDHFRHITGTRIESPFIWECTRFCLSPSASAGSSAILLAASARVMEEFYLMSFVGVFDRRMLPVYRRLRAAPSVLGWSEDEHGKVGVGLWHYDWSHYQSLLSRCGVSPVEMELWLANSDLGTQSLTTQCCALTA